MAILAFLKMQTEDYLYQKKLQLSLSEKKPEASKRIENFWIGMPWSSQALSNMYEKPLVANKVFFIRHSVNTKMKECGSVIGRLNEFNSIISWLVLVDIKLEVEVQALLVLSSLPKSWCGTTTIVSSSYGTAKLTFEDS
ncbi:hypothetical protein L2E82_36844 [Cichorium intybus]|uniref:Uncharacterized protein n=1 Tax=Cichorium intybus TaxID=13427 RepID=A0ACB9AEX2_CICIN|nr:hypothetical protein L2E82_36844 [Cichorium intybus]